MDLRFSDEDEAFRTEARAWLTAQLEGDYAVVRGRGGPGDEHALFDERLAWEQHLGASGWNCVGWPKEHGGRGLSLHQQVIWFEEYARAGGPGRLGHIGEGLTGPTIMAFGTEDQQRRFLPGIVAGTELWAQGYSEPNAGSDLANVATRAEPDGDDWRLTGQKVWTSLAHWSDWAFVLARTDREAVPKHRGISYFLVPLRQDGIEIRPIRQVTGTSEFNEVFFEGALARGGDLVGEVDGGWRVAMGTLAFERGASTLGQQMHFRNELDAVIAVARRNGRIDDPVVRQRLADAHSGLEIMRWNTLRVLSGPDGAPPPPAAMITKLHWASWHRRLGELAVDVLGPEATLADQVVAPGDGYELTALQRLFLFTRSDTIYAGSNQIQRNIIGERALGLPPEPKVPTR
ncbi:MAG TPA: acyl-CoA dehydrogenase family protein [Aquihabitans sp.]|jgi:alkylation response protein AidB-like acyl-CoA dehydrogenase|nr:acyl-CoA dehydrogenase family protein [Aquihabitans sp.]